MTSAAPPWRARCAASAAAAASRAGEVSRIAPSLVKAKPVPSWVMRRCSSPIHCSTGSASKNSLATSSSGRGGRSSMRSWKMAPGSKAACALAQRGAGLDEVDLAREAGAAHHAQRIGGERPAPRAELGIDRVGRGARARPRLGQRGADQFAEHLADLGRGDEVARRARAGRASRNNARWRRPCNRRRRSGRRPRSARAIARPAPRAPP